jgi:hypothetical protein
MFSIAADAKSGHAIGIPLNGNILIDRNLYYAGSVNNSGWNIRPNDAANLWRCDGIDGVSIDGGISWRVTYRFKYNKFTWNHIGTFQDPNTGFPPPDATLGSAGPPVVAQNGKGSFTQYLLTDFTPLELV